MLTKTTAIDTAVLYYCRREHFVCLFITRNWMKIT